MIFSPSFPFMALSGLALRGNHLFVTSYTTSSPPPLTPLTPPPPLLHLFVTSYTTSTSCTSSTPPLTHLLLLHPLHHHLNPLTPPNQTVKPQEPNSPNFSNSRTNSFGTGQQQGKLVNICHSGGRIGIFVEKWRKIISTGSCISGMCSYETPLVTKDFSYFCRSTHFHSRQENDK